MNFFLGSAKLHWGTFQLIQTSARAPLKDPPRLGVLVASESFRGRVCVGLTVIHQIQWGKHTVGKRQWEGKGGDGGFIVSSWRLTESTEGADFYSSYRHNRTADRPCQTCLLPMRKQPHEWLMSGHTVDAVLPGFAPKDFWSCWGKDVTLYDAKEARILRI